MKALLETFNSLWRYALGDLLEMKCQMTPASQEFLIRLLEQTGDRPGEIELCTAFIVNDKVIVILDTLDVNHCWIYYAGIQKMIKRKLQS